MSSGAGGSTAPGRFTSRKRKHVTVVTDDHLQWNVAPTFLSRVVDADSAERRSAALVVRLPIKP